MPKSDPTTQYSPGPDSGAVLGFGPFRLLPAQKLLLEGTQPVRLGSRAMELLMALVDHAGEVVSREELEARVWPRTIVEATSLRVHVSALRKALRDGQDGGRYITNVPGRGYCFVAPVHEVPAGAGLSLQSAAGAHGEAHAQADAARDTGWASRFPLRMTGVVGRKDVTDAIASQLVERRLVSIVGTGGIGKTTVAVAVAKLRADEYEDGVRFVDLAPLSDPQMVAGALALAVGLPMSIEVTLPSLCNFLSHRHMLVIVDNCEHVIGAAASLVEAIVKAAPGLHVLTTSREPLFAEGEWLYRLGPLQVPAATAQLTAAQALDFPAVQLFVERAAASSDGFRLSAETLPAVLQLCHQLDGVPLSIELAAARVASLGVVELAKRLDVLFQLLTLAPRTALSRHRTIEALIDWSFELLTPTEQCVLSRLSVFRSAFTLEDATSVVSDETVPPQMVVDAVLGLMSKSLISVDAKSATSQHRLLYMTREYAERKLAQSGDNAAVRRRHALHLCRMCETARAVFGDLTEQQRAGNFSRTIDDIRAALDWAYSADGDDAIAVELTAAARVRTFNLGLGAEDREWIERGLSRVALLTPPQPVLELRLCIAWCFLSGHTDGMTSMQPQMFARTHALSELPEAAHWRVEALYSMCVGCLGQGRFDLLAVNARGVDAHASGDQAALGVLIGGRMLVFAHHYLGFHDAALALIDPVVDHPTEPRHRWYVAIPHNVSMRMIEARIRWLQGDVAQAMAVAHDVVRNAEGAHPFAMSQALAVSAIPIALWSGNTRQAQVWVEALQNQARQGAIGFWHSWIPCFRQAITRLDDPAAYANGVSTRDWHMPANWSARDLMGTLSEDLVTGETLARVESGAVGWCAPEILRAHAENLLRRDGKAADQPAEALLLRAIEIARKQRAISWELRVVCSLARLWQSSRADEARAFLESVLTRYPPSQDTPDERRARRLLAQLNAPADSTS